MFSANFVVDGDIKRTIYINQLPNTGDLLTLPKHEGRFIVKHVLWRLDIPKEGAGKRQIDILVEPIPDLNVKNSEGQEIQTSGAHSMNTSLHPDDVAVNTFAEVMKAKLKVSREQKGREGWHKCSSQYLSELLREHVEKGDPVDVANLAMMLHQNGHQINKLNVIEE